MKKIVCFVLTFLLMFSMSNTVFAADVENDGGTSSSNVTASYNPGEAGGTVISVDIAWNGLAFTYNDESHPVWDPVNHKYTGEETPAGWATSNANIVITNHSNAFLQAEFEYANVEDYNVSMVFTSAENSSIDTVYVGNADNGAVSGTNGEAQSVTIEVVPTGSIPAETPAGDTIGQITVTIKEDTNTLLELGAGLLDELLCVNEYPKDDASVEYGEYYALEDKLNEAYDALTEFNLAVQNQESDYVKIQALNETIQALYASIKIKK